MTDNLPPEPDTPPASEQPIPPRPAEPPATPQAAAKRTITPLAAGAIGLAVGADLVGGTWAITAAAGPGKPDTFTHRRDHRQRPVHACGRRLRGRAPGYFDGFTDPAQSAGHRGPAV
jgi:hypothetical protein